MSASGGGGVSSGDENVKVAVRCRPFNKREKGMDSKSIVEMENKTLTRLLDPSGKDPHEFVFDFSYDWDTDQDTVYNDLGKPTLEKALNGYNATIFAYGQTGSGKTWSMMGDDERKLPGIIPRLNDDLFAEVGERVKNDKENEFLISVSFLEIYNEVIKDLLNPSDKQLTIREHPKMGIYVQDLASIVVENASAVENLIEQGNKVRRVASTNMNARSSRSHSCFMIRIEQKRTEEHKVGDDTVRKETNLAARLNLVDLAGSERATKTGATGARLKEGAAINKSLTVLGNVINALAETSSKKKKHIPYRDSKLTRLLQESLGGNAMTVMVAAISPADDNFDESLSTLRYANRAKQIKNVAKRNEDVNEAVIRELREEIAELQRMLEESRRRAAEAEEAARSGRALPAAVDTPSASKADDSDSDDEETRERKEREAEQIRELEEKIAALSHAKQASWEEQQRLSRQFEEERKRNLENEEKVRSVMQTIREDNRELLRRMRELVEEHGKLTKRYRKLKEGHSAKRDKLKSRMAKWQRLHEEDGGREDGPHAEELEKILTEVEALHGSLESEQKELKDLKTKIKENEAKQEEERAEASAQRRLLEEDAELRKAIAAEEKKKLEVEAQKKLEEQIEEERRKLQESVEKERAELMAKYGSGSASGPSEREKELELELLSVRRDKDLLRIELDKSAATHEADLKRVAEDAAAKDRENKRIQLSIFRDMITAFEDERKSLEARAKQTARLLAQAASDIQVLAAENDKLRRELYLEAAWEPPIP